MSSGRMLPWIRVVVLAYFFVAAGVTIFAPVGDGVKAPLLTFLGGASIVAVLFPVEFRRLTSIGTALGTIIAMIGSAAWFADATQGELLLETQSSIVGFLFPATLIVASNFAAFATILSVWKAVRSKSAVKPEPRKGKNALLVFGSLSIIFIALHIIRSSIERKRRNDEIG